MGYFIRDKTGNEVDYVSEKGGFLSLVEIKASKTLNTDHLKGIEYWENVIRESRRDSFLVYAGNEEKTFKSTKFIRWNNISQIIT